MRARQQGEEGRLTRTHEQVIADLYEKYIELIGTVKEDGETTSDGYVCSHPYGMSRVGTGDTMRR